MSGVLFEEGQVQASPWALVGRMHEVFMAASAKVDLSQQKRLGFVSDLDDTALITAFRTANLFEHFVRSGEVPEGLSGDQGVARVWDLARKGRMPYNVRLLLEGSPEELAKAWFDYWAKHFFTNEALAADLPQAQIKSLLQLLVRRGVPVGYLTGRHLPGQPPGRFPAGMVQGTLHSLWKHDFPHGPVVFKPAYEVPDLGYKRDHFAFCQDLDATGLIPVGYVDNEPEIVNLHDSTLEEMGIPHLSLWLDTVHAPLKEDVALRPGVVVLKLRR